MTKAVIVFFIALAVYFVVLVIWTLIKRHKAKKRFNKEKEGIDNVTKKEENKENRKS